MPATAMCLWFERVETPTGVGLNPLQGQDLVGLESVTARQQPIPLANKSQR